MLFALTYSWLRLLLDLVDVRRRVDDPEAELLLLRHQLRVVRRQVNWLQLNAADRTLMAALSQVVNRVALVGMLVQPETVLAWHRELVRRKWAAFGRPAWPGSAGSRSRDPEADSADGEGQSKVGFVRVRGELLKLGHMVSATAIRKLLRRNRIGPAPLRSRLTWKAFLQAQASAIVLTDFLSVDTVFLKRLYVLLYMELATRRVIWFAVTDRPDAAWVTQQARKVSWELKQLGVTARFLIHDHDDKYGGGSDGHSDRGAKDKFTHGAPNWLDQAQVSRLASDHQSSASRARLDSVARALQPGSPASWAGAAHSDCAVGPGCDVGTPEVR